MPKSVQVIMVNRLQLSLGTPRVRARLRAPAYPLGYDVGFGVIRSYQLLT